MADAPVVGGRGTVVLPGLINAHHHGNGITSFARGVADDNLEPWLAALGEAPDVDPYLDTLWAAIDTLEAGYTTLVLFQTTTGDKGDADQVFAKRRRASKRFATRASQGRVRAGCDAKKLPRVRRIVSRFTAAPWPDDRCIHHAAGALTS